MNDEEYEDFTEGAYYAVRPNKTQIKKEFAALFLFGEEISKLAQDQVDALQLPEKVRQAVRQAAVMPHNGARKRLIKFIAGELHQIDVSPYVEKLERLKSKSAHGVREHHLAERWRDRLLAESNDAATEFLDQYPLADSQQLRQLIRNALKEAKEQRPPKSSRLLYRYVKSLLHNDEDPTDTDRFAEGYGDDSLAIDENEDGFSDEGLA